MSVDKQKLFAEFPPVTTAQWEAVIEKDLKGADYDKKLVWKTAEGFNVRPYYRAEDLEKIPFLNAAPGEFPYVRGIRRNNNWRVRQTIEVNDPRQANALARQALMRGVDSLGFKVNTTGFAAKYVDELLEGIELSAIELHIEGWGCGDVAEHLVKKLEAEKKYNPEELRISIGCDPVVFKISTQGDPSCMDKGGYCVVKVGNIIKSFLPYRRSRQVCIAADIFNSCGATIVQELAFALSAGHESLVRFMGYDLTVDQVARAMQFKFAIGANYFMEIAKFRAARMLWANIVSEYKPERSCSAKMHIHAVTSRFNMTVYDPYVNLLRGTTEAMSAALGGVDSMEVLPFDATFDEAGEFSSRIARNVQLLLKEESHFDQVVDPAGGAYYIENLTASIADEAWKIFRRIEDMGGYLAAFKAGFIRDELEKSAAAKLKNLATRRATLLGTNQYPNFLEKASEKIAPATVGVREGGETTSDQWSHLAVKPLRGAMEFEQLRLAVDRSGKNPRAFMLTVGNLAMARARAQFSSNFFACAGIEPIDNIRFDTVQQGVAAALKAGAEIVVLCSSDDEYATLAPEAFAALGGRAIFVVAGAPASQPELEAAGIKNFISVRSNVLETLKSYLKGLGIQ